MKQDLFRTAAQLREEDQDTVYAPLKKRAADIEGMLERTGPLMSLFACDGANPETAGLIAKHRAGLGREALAIRDILAWLGQDWP